MPVLLQQTNHIPKDSILSDEFVSPNGNHLTTICPARKNRIRRGRFGFSRSCTSSNTKNGLVTVSRIFKPSRDYIVTKEFNISYRIDNPQFLTSSNSAPIIVLHGGPSIPSNYLYPLVDTIPNKQRSIIFYDQLGCGKSSAPSDINAYSIENAVIDLETLLQKLNIRRFHLYGHSFGGILAFEFLKRNAEKFNHNPINPGSSDPPSLEEENAKKLYCLSVILSSAPSNIQQVDKEGEALFQSLSILEDGVNVEHSASARDKFRKKHVCRTEGIPKPLRDAYDQMGTVWEGTSVIKDYFATRPSADASKLPPALVQIGEFDFISNTYGLKGWKEAFNHDSVVTRTLKGCSHHGMLENRSFYGENIEAFFAEHDSCH